MDEKRNREGSAPEAQVPNPRDAQGFQENPAPQGLKTPPEIKDGEDSGEWTRGGGTDPDEGDGKK
ncbi:MAG TPA: hypothetical protein VKJ00_08265 [Thermoanaerobaculia bacterium]|nr:hypothetical protein [Thermoanaerobaculia bacterium]